MELPFAQAAMAMPNVDTEIFTMAQPVSSGPAPSGAPHKTEARMRYEYENRVKTRVRKWLVEGGFQWTDDDEFRETLKALAAPKATVNGERFS